MFLRCCFRVLVLAAVGLVAAVTWAADPFPGTLPGVAIGGNLPAGYETSGIVWHSRVQKLFLVSDGGTVSSMNADGAGVTNWSVGGDLEGVTVARPESNFIYLGIEHPDSVREFNTATGQVTRSFDLTPWMTGPDNSGLEALTFVPDAGDPEGGLFYAGLQADGRIFKFRLPILSSTTSTAVTHVGTLAALNGVSDISDMHYEAGPGVLYAIYDSANLLRAMTPGGTLIREWTLPGNDQEGLTLKGTDLYIGEDYGSGGNVFRYANFAGKYWAPSLGGGGSGTWDSNSNVWSATSGTQGTLPQSTAETLIFTGTAGTVAVNGTASATSGLEFSTNGYSVVAGNSSPKVRLDGASAAGNTITVTTGTTTISVELTGGGAIGLVKAGAGTLVLAAAANTYSNGTTVDAGVLQLDTANAVPAGSNLTLTGTAKATLGGSSSVNLGSAVKLGDLNINAHATSGLTATLDLNTSKLIVDKTQVPVATIRAQIKSAYAASRWTGSGITSAAAAADYAANGGTAKTGVGYLDNGIAASAGGSKTTWAGRSVDSNSVLVRYTYYGDCNLDGSVNLSDFGIFKQNFGTGSQWYQGDFNYDGSVNLPDFGKLKQAFGSTALGAGQTVPEPSTLALLAGGALGLLACVWRRGKANALAALIALAVACFGGMAQADVFNMGGTRNPDGSWTGLASLEMVAVGNAGNVGELSGASVPGGYGPDRICGGVDYNYQIGKYEVTAGQYTAFLNAVAKTDNYGLYSPYMWETHPIWGDMGCKIQRLGSPGDYAYNVAAEWANRPVNYVTWGSAARFANWLTNGQPATGVQDVSTTEDGSYLLNGATTGQSLMSVTRKALAHYAIPTEDEWYKAAYYKNDGVTGNYWKYPTRTSNVPSNILGDPDPGNNANFRDNGYTLGPPYYRTEVGAFESSMSPFETFDQGGNVWEWNETVVQSWTRGLRGGAFYSEIGSLNLGAFDRDSIAPTDVDSYVGFRIASVPEASALALLTTGAIGLLGWAWRRRNRAVA